MKKENIFLILAGTFALILLLTFFFFGNYVPKNETQEIILALIAWFGLPLIIIFVILADECDKKIKLKGVSQND